ncbi:uncharacterized protein YjiS (DUF1127 family) [Bradyrhizobium sp. AZCC 1578]|uniref:DUF1127 domain-containing protein n=1 Tax=unclassified Bradyrhizobium TaxID=2631580 RepID=UPI002FEF4BFA
MITIRGATELGQTTAKRQVYSPLEIYWDAFQEWRKRERLRARLCRLSERELTDIGITRGEIDYVASNRGVITPHLSTGWQNGGALMLMMLCNACILVSGSEAEAQCTARDVLQNQLRLTKIPSPTMPRGLVRSAVDVPAWKKITVGTFSGSFALLNALSAIGCGVGDSAGEILARPAFTLSATKTDVELFTVSAAELGFKTETASLGQIYARAQELGFGLATPEIAPQLRLQYLDQPIGEFLIIGMEPIKTWKGEPVILTVANGGAGLILIGQDGRADAQISVASRFLFVQSKRAAPAEAALVHR